MRIVNKFFFFIFTAIFFCSHCFGAVSFDGVDDYLYGENIISANTNSITMAVWVYWKDSNNGGVWFYNGDSGANGYGMATINASCAASNKIGFIVGFRSCDSLNCGTTLSINEWVHVAFVLKSNGYIDKYVNGVFDCQSGGSVSPGTPTIISGLGYSIGTGTTLNSGDFIDVAVKEFYFWETELSANEIAILAKSKTVGIGLQIQPSNLKIYLPLNDVADGVSGDGKSFLDLSVNKNSTMGIDGANNTGLTGLAETVLTYP